MNMEGQVLAHVAYKTDEEEAVWNVIQSETEAFVRSDFDAWSDCWLQSPRTIDVYSSQDIGLIIHHGWDKISQNMRDTFAVGHGCANKVFEKKNVQITIDGDMAWVIFDEISRVSVAHKEEQSFETRILERTATGWKIVLASLVVKGEQTETPNRLAVLKNGEVIWMAPGTDQMLKDCSGFTISAGRLRASKPQWDKVLQDALARAEELHSYFAQHRYLKETGHRFRYPIILGEDEHGHVVWCALSVRDGRTYVDFDPNAILERQLLSAKVIFGLSDGQLALAKQIANGDSLKSCAETLGISVNTARTHLTRIYDKTGVNSQTALVRLLLSVT